jgi:hypothetical protein
MSAALQPLWRIEDELLALLDSVATCDQELLPELQQQIDSYMGAEAVKVDGISHVLAALEWEQKCASDEIARLQERKKAAAKAQDRLEAYVVRCIQARGVKKLAGQTTTLATRASDAVMISDADAIPVKYQFVSVKMSGELWQSVIAAVVAAAPEDVRNALIQIMPERSISKESIKKALKSNIHVPGADLEYRHNLVRK